MELCFEELSLLNCKKHVFTVCSKYSQSLFWIFPTWFGLFDLPAQVNRATYIYKKVADTPLASDGADF